MYQERMWELETEQLQVHPEVLFHRFFQSDALNTRDRERYQGKQDLDRLEPDFRSVLINIQNALNEALRNEKASVREHVPHPPFHFDYVASSVPNALAFQFRGFSFIGITIRLVYMLWDAGFRLSRSEPIASALRVPLTAELSERIHTLLLGTELAFVVAHEYTHHIHGHVKGFRSDIFDETDKGTLEDQAREVDADCYAIYHVLADLIDGARRPSALALLGLEQKEKHTQDQVLFSSAVIAVGGFLFAWPPVPVDNISIYRLRHPPHAARLNFILHSSITWAKQNVPALLDYMTLEKFQAHMNAVAGAVWGMNGGADWSAQTAFLRSSEGGAYISSLDKSVKAHIRSL
jgi:hypothetical protein